MAAVGSLHIKGVSYQYLKDTERFERTGQVIIYSEGIIVIWNSMALASLISRGATVCRSSRDSSREALLPVSTLREL